MKILAAALILLTGWAVILAYIAEIVNVESSDVRLPSEKLMQDSSLIDERADALFWFIQVSDLHISKYFGYDRAPDLIKFCQQHIRVINPDLVVATGDLTDAKFRDLRGSRQYVEEWKRYQDTVNECLKITKAKWLDLRGNHDSFDVPDTNHVKNLFRYNISEFNNIFVSKEYSMQGKYHSNTYTYTHKKPYGNYSFIAVDACPDPGPRRPFNFFGYLSKKQSDAVKQQFAYAGNSNLTIAFGHYPTSLIISEDGQSVRQLIRDSKVYLCGHLHTLAGLVPNMYARHKTGTLELEVGDWKDNRIYRVLAVDHDLMSFTDEKLGDWPVVIVTNPKHALFLTSQEPAYKIGKSSHIRLLIFSPNNINKADIYINDIYMGNAQQIKGPLFVLPWKPTNYAAGLHSIKVIVEDEYSRRKVINQPFSIDGSQPGFSLVPRLILMLNIFNLGKLLFLFLLIVYILLLLLLRNLQSVKTIYVASSRFIPGVLTTFVNNWLYRIWLVSKTSSLFYGLVIFILYIALGPWFIAELLEDHLGVVFIWGMYVNGSFLPGSLTYFYGIFQIITFHIPLLMFLGYMVHFIKDEKKRHTNSQIFRHVRHLYIPFGALMIFHIYIMLSEFPAAYGTKAMVLGPVRTGSILVAVILYHIAKKNAIVIPHSPSHRS